MFCPDCKKEINDESALFCDECGAALVKKEEAVQKKENTVPEAPAKEIEEATEEHLPEEQASQDNDESDTTPVKNKKSLLPVIISVAAVLVFLVVFLLIRSGNSKDTDSSATTDNISGDTQTTSGSELPSDPTKPDRNEWIEETKATEEKTTEATATEVPDNTIVISSELQYDVNIFLSNFSESNLASFVGSPHKDEILFYALSYNFINKPEVYEKGSFGTFSGKACNLRISETEIEKTVLKYFDISLKPSFHQQFGNYSDGFYYADSADFRDYGYTVVSKIERAEPGIFTLHFDIYSDGVSHNYNMTSAQAEKLAEAEGSSLRLLGSGKAKIKSADIHNRSTYILSEYSVKRNEPQQNITYPTTAVHTTSHTVPSTAPDSPVQGTTSAYDNETIEYMYPTDTTELTREYLSTLNREQIIILTNEIYARHGYIFKSEKLQRYFSKRAWYHGYEPSMELVSQQFTQMEHKNLRIIVEYKESIGMD